MSLPQGKVLVPVSKLGKLETDGKHWKETQIITVLQRRGDGWCRTSDDELKLWKAPGRGGDLFVLWPGAAAYATRLQQALQKKAVLTADGKNFAFCGSEADGSPMSSGIQYD
jgi:hypothetical protein